MIDYKPHQFFSHLFQLKGSIAGQILWRVGVATGVGAVLVALHYAGYTTTLPALPHTVVGSALSLLLAFRTNTAYDRFWEGRKLWGGIVNESRNLVRSAHASLSKEAPELYTRLAHWTIAFSYATMNALRGRQGFNYAPSELPASQLEAAQKAPHGALFAAARMTELLAEAQKKGLLTDFRAFDLENNVNNLVDCLGGCERIHKTPLPFAYVVHLRRALVLYCTTLPIVLVRDLGWRTVIVTAVVSFVLYGFEEIGVEIEDPFGTDDNDLPLERICGTIENNIKALIQGEPPSHVPEEQAPEDPSPLGPPLPAPPGRS